MDVTLAVVFYYLVASFVIYRFTAIYSEYYCLLLAAVDYDYLTFSIAKRHKCEHYARVDC